MPHSDHECVGGRDWQRASSRDSEQDGRDGSDTESEDDEDTRTVGALLERAETA